VNCTAYVLFCVCELYMFGCRQFLELLRPELMFFYFKKPEIILDFHRFPKTYYDSIILLKHKSSLGGIYS
jgi:hypothetical protein